MLALRIDELRHWYIVKGFWAKLKKAVRKRRGEKAERIPITWLHLISSQDLHYSCNHNINQEVLWWRINFHIFLNIKYYGGIENQGN
jgi:hypothetical protein